VRLVLELQAQLVQTEVQVLPEQQGLVKQAQLVQQV
jgi:hypothetical protein